VEKLELKYKQEFFMIYENEIEQLAIDLLKEIGYEYYHGQEIAPNSQNPKRQSLEEVIHEEDLRSALKKLNPKHR
jgi:Type I restriction enzyme R protein N terminus (HSDR_N).